MSFFRLSYNPNLTFLLPKDRVDIFEASEYEELVNESHKNNLFYVLALIKTVNSHHLYPRDAISLHSWKENPELDPETKQKIENIFYFASNLKNLGTFDFIGNRKDKRDHEKIKISLKISQNEATDQEKAFFYENFNDNVIAIHDQIELEIPYNPLQARFKLPLDSVKYLSKKFQPFYSSDKQGKKLPICLAIKIPSFEGPLDASDLFGLKELKQKSVKQLTEQEKLDVNDVERIYLIRSLEEPCLYRPIKSDREVSLISKLFENAKKSLLDSEIELLYAFYQGNQVPKDLFIAYEIYTKIRLNEKHQKNFQSKLEKFHQSFWKELILNSNVLTDFMRMAIETQDEFLIDKLEKAYKDVKTSFKNPLQRIDWIKKLAISRFILAELDYLHHLLEKKTADIELEELSNFFVKIVSEATSHFYIQRLLECYKQTMNLLKMNFNLQEAFLEKLIRKQYIPAILDHLEKILKLAQEKNLNDEEKMLFEAAFMMDTTKFYSHQLKSTYVNIKKKIDTYHFADWIKDLSEMHFEPAMYDLAIFLLEGRYLSKNSERALFLLDQLFQKDNQSDTVRYHLAVCLSKLHKFNEASLLLNNRKSKTDPKSKEYEVYVSIVQYEFCKYQIQNGEYESLDQLKLMSKFLFEILDKAPKKLRGESLFIIADIYKMMGDKEMYLKYLNESKEHECLKAYFELSRFYESQGKFKEAISLLKESSKRGHVESHYRLGLLYHKQNNIFANNELSFQSLKIAAERGVNAAEYHLGVYYRFGVGVHSDNQKSFIWIEKAAKKGHLGAQNDLGSFYERGIGVEKDLKLAVFWYSKAFKGGHSLATFNLANCYLNGVGEEVDLVKSYKLFRIAEERGISLATSFLNLFLFDGVNVLTIDD